MLNPRNNRQNYGTQLQAPAGYELRNAICTTYALDLEILMAATISLGLCEETDSELQYSPLNNLHALRTVAEKLVVFCEAGQMTVPKNTSSLMSMMEKMVVEVALTKPRGEKLYPSFHPKTWMILYENSSGELWGRFIVMSRNLTTDRSWDVSVLLEGPVTDKIQKRNLPLQDFLTFINAQVKDQEDSAKHILRDIKKWFPYVKFELEEPFTDFEIIPIHRGGAKMTEDELWLTKPDELLMISPFLDKQTISHWSSWSSTTKKLVTRVSELEKIRDCHGNTDVYTIRTELVEGENNLPEIIDSNDKDICSEDIHAKLYLWHKGRDKWLYMGSMNASHRGMEINCEMMLALYTDFQGFSLNRLWTDMASTNEKDCPFELVDWETLPIEEPATDDTDILTQQIKDLCRCSMYADVLPNNDGYDVHIHVEGNIPQNMNISSMLAQGKRQTLSSETILSGLNLLELSEFYMVTAHGESQDLSKLIRVSTTPMPENREEKILAHYFDQPEKFALYIGLVLAGRDTYSRACIMNGVMNGRESMGSISLQMPALYEQLLKASVYNPEQIQEIADIVDRIKDENIISPEFRNTFAMFYKKKGGRNG